MFDFLKQVWTDANVYCQGCEALKKSICNIFVWWLMCAPVVAVLYLFK